MPSAPFVLLDKLADGHGAVVADYYHCPSDEMIYVRWYGHLTAAEVVDGFRNLLVWQQKLKPRRLLLDRSRTTGEWAEALPWVSFEWLPTAPATGLEAVSYVLSADLPSRHDSETFLQAVRGYVPVEMFGSSHEALAWLCHPHKVKSTLPA